METTLTARLLRPLVASEEPHWLSAARAGEPWALEQFYHQFQPQVYALCHRLLGRAEDAQDATQTTFVRAFRALPGFRGESIPRTWVYRIAVNESLGMLRRRRESPEPAADGRVSPDGSLGVVERMAVNAALDALKPAHRAILVLRFWESLSYEEIAQVLGISLAATKMRLKRAREEFRSQYEGGR